MFVPDVTQELLVPNAMPLYVLKKQRQPLLVDLNILKTPVNVFVSNRNVQYFGGMSGVIAVRREEENGRIRELQDELTRDEQQERCKCSIHLALFASLHSTAFLLHTDYRYANVVSYICSIFLSDKAT